MSVCISGGAGGEVSVNFKVDLKSRQHQEMDQKQNGKCLFPYSASHRLPRGGTMNMQWGGAMDMTVNVKAERHKSGALGAVIWGEDKEIRSRIWKGEVERVSVKDPRVLKQRMMGELGQAPRPYLHVF